MAASGNVRARRPASTMPPAVGSTRESRPSPPPWAAHLRHDGPWSDAITRHSAAVQAAQRAGDAPAEANARHDLGITERLTGDYPAATRSLTAALGIYRDAGNRLGAG